MFNQYLIEYTTRTGYLTFIQPSVLKGHEGGGFTFGFFNCENHISNTSKGNQDEYQRAVYG